MTRLGEAYDKVARVLDVPFPGGPPIDKAAPRGAIRPRSAFLAVSTTTALSTSRSAGPEDGGGPLGGSTAGRPTTLHAPDVAASFQEAVADVLTRKAVQACQRHDVTDLIIGGGVAANSRLRSLAAERCAAAGIKLRVPRPGLCTDNGAMVAALGAEIVSRGLAPSPLDLPADSSSRHRGAGPLAPG